MIGAALLSSMVALLGAQVARVVDAHGGIFYPPPEFTGNWAGWVVNIDEYWPEVGTGGDQVGTFAKLATEKGVSVRDVLEEMAPNQKCGYTDENAEPRDIPTNGTALFRSNIGGGFGHQGPCEIWLDDTMVFHNDNCEDNYPGDDATHTMSTLPVDYSACGTSCVFHFFWLAFQNEQWQAYINCVPLAGEAVASESSSTPESTTSAPEPTTATPEPTTATPEPTTATPEPTTATPEPTTSAPEPTTTAPEPATVIPASGSSACQRRLLSNLLIDLDISQFDPESSNVKFISAFEMVFHALSTVVALATGSLSLMLPQVNGHGFLYLPEASFNVDKPNYYAYVVPIENVPLSSSDISGDIEQNAANFQKSYASGSWSNLRDFILTNQVNSGSYENRPEGGTAECGFSLPDATPQPLPDHLEYGNNKGDHKIIHPGPCEVWCDDEITVAFQEDCRVFEGINIPYDKSVCEGKSRMTFYWLATHYPPFQVYISCVPLQGGSSTTTSSLSTNNTTIATTATTDTASTDITPSTTDTTTSSVTAMSTPTAASMSTSTTTTGINFNQSWWS